ncbi:hypothetical protein IWW50_006437, partial [Coemansia erecta]
LPICATTRGPSTTMRSALRSAASSMPRLAQCTTCPSTPTPTPKCATASARGSGSLPRRRTLSTASTATFRGPPSRRPFPPTAAIFPPPISPRRRRPARRRRTSALPLPTLATRCLARATPMPTLPGAWHPFACAAPTLQNCATGSWLPSS